MQVDAIVNTTNVNMIGYSGVDRAVHIAAGPELDRECSQLPRLGLGSAVVTGGYNLPAKHVIHTVGPKWCGGKSGESIILRSCYTESLKLAVKHGFETVAFPLISSGVHGFPKDEVLKFATSTIAEFLSENELTVYLCVFDKESYTFSKTLFDDIKSFMESDTDWSEPSDTYVDIDARSYSTSARRCTVLPQERDDSTLFFIDPLPAPRESKSVPSIEKSLDEYLEDHDRSFREMLFELIDNSGMSDVQCYKNANIDKRIFSKIKSLSGYHPSKQTAVAFAISLKLDLEQTQELLATAGYTLSSNNVFDKIIRYFIHRKNYNVFDINEALFEFDQLTLGSGTTMSNDI